jgi:nicotinate-nucleotide--dimethylbenzimidazole phosphoribosyltransferase
MTLLDRTCAKVVVVDGDAAREAQGWLDRKTKPRGSLGVLEDLACSLAAVYRRPDAPVPARAIVVMAADHGVAEEGVSAYPAEVTAQMLANFAAGGAAINVLARHAGARLVVVDMGAKTAGELPGVREHRLGPGTMNFTRGPAMSRAQAVLGLETGIRLAAELAEEGVGLLGIGEMGIANTTAASALTAVLTGRPADEVTGRGTGIDEARRRHKVDVIERALALHRPSLVVDGGWWMVGGEDRGSCLPPSTIHHPPSTILEVLARLGGFEIAGLAGVLLGAAARGVPVLLDGFITGAAALVAVALCPNVRDYLIAAHRSAEPGHRAVLEHLRLRPLLELDMRLGEGTGAALAMSLVDASLRLLHEMATFDEAGVTDATPEAREE